MKILLKVILGGIPKSWQKCIIKRLHNFTIKFFFLLKFYKKKYIYVNLSFSPNNKSLKKKSGKNRSKIFYKYSKT